MRNRDTIEFLGLWEQLNNPDFKPVEFGGFRTQAGSNAFTMSPKKWIEATRAIGIVSKAGRYGGTFAQKDIAFEFASWISAEFKLYIIKDYQRLKNDENSRLALGWNLNRTLAKINYRVHTDAIKDMLIPPDVTPQRQSYTYANEADVLNVALFGITAKEWRLPASKMKMRQRHIVPLSRQALSILAELQPYTGNGRFLFPSIRTDTKPISIESMLVAIRSMGFTKDEMTMHGFRGMASTLLNEMGYNRDWIERQLAHGERDHVRAAYNYAEHLPERRRMMQKWADYLDGLRGQSDPQSANRGKPTA